MGSHPPCFLPVLAHALLHLLEDGALPTFFAVYRLCLLQCTRYTAWAAEPDVLGELSLTRAPPEQATNTEVQIFMLFTIFGQLVQQMMPHFVTQRALYEARERPSKTYSWKAFMFASITVELPWNTLMAVIIFFCFYYPVGLCKHPYGQHPDHLSETFR